MAGSAGYNKMFPVSRTELHRDARALAWRPADLGPFKGLVAITRGGHVRVCTNENCKTEHFPRTDPAVIMLVHHGDKCLLGRGKHFPRGMQR